MEMVEIYIEPIDEKFAEDVLNYVQMIKPECYPELGVKDDGHYVVTCGFEYDGEVKKRFARHMEARFKGKVSCR